jgi:hypothetical protein
MPRQLVALEHQAGLLHCSRLVEAGANRPRGLSRTSGRMLSPVAQRFAEIIRVYAQDSRGAGGRRAKRANWSAGLR